MFNQHHRRAALAGLVSALVLLLSVFNAGAGPPESLGQQNNANWLNYDDITPGIVNDNGTLRAIVSWGNGTWQQYQGSSIDGMSFTGNASYSIPRPHADDAYWLGDIWVNPADGSWLGVVHAEYNYTSSGHQRRILVARSTDKGATWNNVGDIVTPDSNFTPPVSGAVTYGDGDQRLVIDSTGGYFYLFYWTGYYVPSGTLTAWINVARCPISSAMAAGCWTKWYNGSFSEPGLGGHDGQIMSFTGQFTPGTFPSEFNYNDVPMFTYDSYLGKFLAMGHDWVSTATDLSTQNWTLPTVITGGTSTAKCWYLWALDPTTGSKYAVGQTFRYYGTGTGCDFQGQYQNVTLNADPSQISAWYASNGWTHIPWRYEYSTNNEASFSPMSYNTVNGQWTGSETYCTVFSANQQHPGSAGCDSSRTWQAPYAANVTLGANGPITVAAGCGGNTAGTNIRILKNGTQIWPASGWVNIPNGGSYTFPSGVTTSVNGGDKIEFVVAKNGSVNYCDATTWDAQVSAAGGPMWQASDMFAKAWDQWQYEYSTNNEASFSPMSFNTGNGQWTGSETYCTVFAPTKQHPGSAGCDSSRAWQAPYAANVTLGANGPITVAAGCGGNTAGTNIRILKNGTQIWPASGWVNIPNGGSYTFPSGVTTSVNGGDKIEFVVAKNGSVNYCDATTWDASVTKM